MISAGIITTFAGVGQEAGDDAQNFGYATSMHLRQPQGVFVTQKGDVYVADTNNQKIRKVSFGFSYESLKGLM